MAGSEQVFEERLSEHVDGLYRTALRLAGQERGAAELVTAAVRQAAQTLHTGVAVPVFRFELFGALLRQARWARPAGVIGPTFEPGGGFDLAQVTDSQLLKAIDGLELPFRLAIWLHDVEGFTMKELAQLLGLPVRDAMTCLYGARVTVQQVLARARFRHQERGA